MNTPHSILTYFEPLPLDLSRVEVVRLGRNTHQAHGSISLEEAQVVRELVLRAHCQRQDMELG